MQSPPLSKGTFSAELKKPAAGRGLGFASVLMGVMLCLYRWCSPYPNFMKNTLGEAGRHKRTCISAARVRPRIKRSG